MAKVTLTDITSGYGTPTKYNDNNASLEAAIENTLSRDGTSPNEMEAALDMNSNRIINLPAPENHSDAARLQDVEDSIGNQATAVLTSISDSGGFYDGTNVEGALQEIGRFDFDDSRVRTAAEISAGVTPTNKAYAPYNLLRYGADPTGAANSNTAFSNWKLACDAADSEGVIPEGTYAITTNIELPNKTRCYGNITGTSEVRYTNQDYGWVTGVQCQKFLVKGAFRSKFTDIQATAYLNVSGNTGGHGVFWCNFFNCDTPSCTLDSTDWAVNLNTFTSCILRYLHLVGVPSSSGHEINANCFISCDFTNNSLPNYGILQEDTARKANFLINSYFEAGSTVQGNFHVLGHTYDGTGTLMTDRFTHILGSMGANQRDARDMLSLQLHNEARGGSWDWLDSSGKPVCLSTGGSVSGVSVATDATEPCGIGKAYQATLGGADAQFQIVVQPSNIGNQAAVVFYKSTSNFIAVSANGTAIDVTPVVIDSTNNWKMLRIEYASNTATPSTIQLIAQTGTPSGSPVFSIGGIFAGAQKAIVYPQKNDEYSSRSFGSDSHRAAVGATEIQAGQVTQTSTATNPIDISITFPQQYTTAAPRVTYSIEDDASGNYTNITSHAIKASTLTTSGFTVRVNHSGNFSGRINWIAVGNRL